VLGGINRQLRHTCSFFALFVVVGVVYGIDFGVVGYFSDVLCGRYRGELNGGAVVES
jgi:hypothetical protein